MDIAKNSIRLFCKGVPDRIKRLLKPKLLRAETVLLEDVPFKR